MAHTQACDLEMWGLRAQDASRACLHACRAELHPALPTFLARDKS